MCLIRLSALSKLCFKNHTVLYTVTRNHWNKDYKPGPYPKTPAERLAAAKKYNVCPSVYKPYPNDGTGLGDYPDLPLESGDSKDPFYPWDNPELKRNFNEPLVADAEMIGEDRYDVKARHRIPIWHMLLQTVVVFATTFGCYYYCQNIRCFLAIAEKQYASSGDTHYTFERLVPEPEPEPELESEFESESGSGSGIGVKPEKCKIDPRCATIQPMKIDNE